MFILEKREILSAFPDVSHQNEKNNKLKQKDCEKGILFKMYIYVRVSYV